MTDRELLLAIQKVLDGNEWSPDTAEAVARLLNENGYPIAPPDDGFSPPEED